MLVCQCYGGWLRNPAPVDRWSVYAIIYRVSTCFNQGDAGFLPSPPGPDFSKELARMLPYGTFMASTCETAWFKGNKQHTKTL